MAAPKKCPDELRERAVPLYRESDPELVIRRLAEQLGIGVPVEQHRDLSVEDLDLLGDREERGDERAGHAGGGRPGGADRSAGCGAQVRVQDSRVLVAGVVVAAQPGSESGRGKPVGVDLGRELGEEPQLVRPSRSANRPTGPGWRSADGRGAGWPARPGG
ncbi:hypothetical protein [Pseudonocardia sp. N23]|uniref:hypothetical protein n=1 Tax=Pseudonocardia sp. N23 TaxID=1987376 RepID=UPI001146050E|nr:hypothetical protein [Pseudonocardia sp. N23]